MIHTGLLSARLPEAFAKATTFGQLALKGSASRNFPGLRPRLRGSSWQRANSRFDLN